MYTLDLYNHKTKVVYDLCLQPMTYKQARTMRSKFTSYKHRSVRIRRLDKIGA